MGCGMSSLGPSTASNLEERQNTEPPPNYGDQHTNACRALLPWQELGILARNYQWQVFFLSEEVFSGQDFAVQTELLFFLAQLQNISKFSVQVRSVEFSSATEQDKLSGMPKRLLGDMLQAKSVEEAIREWNTRKQEAFPGENIGPTSRNVYQQVDRMITAQNESKALDDLSAKNLVNCEIVAALASYNKGWDLATFLKEQDNILRSPRTFGEMDISNSVLLQAQFRCIFRSAKEALSIDGGSPTVVICIVPRTCSNSTEKAIEKEYSAAVMELKNNSDRNDAYSISTWSIGGNSNVPATFDSLDDCMKGGRDILDNTNICPEKFRRCGPGPLLARKLLFGSTDRGMDNLGSDRGLKKAPKAELYGKGSFNYRVPGLTLLRQCPVHKEYDPGTTQNAQEDQGRKLY